MYERLLPLFGEDGIERLNASTVLVVGCGGVGSFAIEALARSGVGTLILVDKDTVEASNLNRQLGALHSTLGQMKVDVLKARIQDINPACKVITYGVLYNDHTKHDILNHPIDFVFDAIDTVTCKLNLIEECLRRHLPFITSCGQGNRMEPQSVVITELSKTAYDPIARVMRSQVRKRKIKAKIPCVYSKEIPMKLSPQRQPASNALVPSTAGLTAASYIIQSLLKG